jgi:hypothetical protein
LFIGGYWADEIDLWHLKTTRIMPESFEYAENGGRKYLLRNRGDGSSMTCRQRSGSPPSLDAGGCRRGPTR